MSIVISNVEIEKLLKKSSDDLKQNLAGIFTSDHLNRFISFHNLIKEKKTRCSFMIVNTDRSDKNETH